MNRTIFISCGQFTEAEKRLRSQVKADQGAGMKTEPQPCKRFKHMNWTAAFAKHLPKCAKCRAVIAYPEIDLEMLLRVHRHRN